MSSPAAASSLPSSSRRVLSFATADGSRTLVGVLDSASDHNSDGNRCALLCHGMLASGEEFFLPALAQALLAAPAASAAASSSTSAAAARSALLIDSSAASRSLPIVDHVFRLDFSGHAGASTGGHFSYGGYARLVEEIEETVRYLQREQKLKIALLVGHSMGANSVLLYAAKHCTSAAASVASSMRIPRVIAIAPRFEMTVDHRFSKTELLGLLKDGVMHLRRGRGKPPMPITIEEYQTRLRLDMTCVRQIDAGVTHTLLLHALDDAVIPVRDSFRMHHWITAKCEEPESGPLAVASDSTCKPTSLDRSSPLTPADFSPALASSLPHAFVPIPAATHLFDSARETALVCALVCAWAEMHSDFAAANAVSAAPSTAAASSSDAAAAGAKTQGAKL